MKKAISLLLSAALLAGTFSMTAAAADATAEVNMYLQSADYDTNKAVLALTLSGVEAESYTYQWYNSNEENGTYSPMYKETNSTYVLSSNDHNTYIRCEITPVLADGSVGDVITSNSYFLSPTRGAMRFGNVTLDQTTVANYKDNPSTYKVSVGGETIIILDEYDDSFYVITDGFKGSHTFGDSATYQFLPNDTTNIGYYLNNDFLTSNTISAAMQKYIPSHTWWVEEACDKARVPYSFEAKIGLLSVTEYGKYLDRIGWGPHSATGDWWLRNSRPWTTGPNINKVIVTSETSRYGQTNGESSGDASNLVRPTFYLSEDIFLEEKATVSSMGSGIKEMFAERYTTEEEMAKLEALYTQEELAAIGFETETAFVTSSKTPAAALSELTVDYTDENAVSYEYQWLISNSADSGYVPAVSETSEKYIVSNYDMNKYIKAQVTPVYADGSKGETVTTSNYVNVASLGVLSRTDYSAEEREANKNNPTENYVFIGNEALWILDEFYDDTQSFYVITGAKGRQAFDPDSTTKFDPSDSNNIAARLNGEFLTSGLADTGATDPVTYTISSQVQNYIPTVTWWTEAGHKDSNSPEDYSVEAKIGLMSRSEYTKYWGKFGWDPNETLKSGWWLRTGRGSGGTATTVFVALGVSNSYPTATSNSWGNTWNKEANSTGYYLRPTFYLNESIFTELKANVSTMGSDVKQMLVRRFTAEELSHLYTSAELRTIGFDVSAATIISSTQTPAALTTLTIDYVDENAVDYEYKWMLSDSENGEYITAMTENESTYLITTYDMNKYIKAEVIPVYADGSKGEAVETSNVINVTAMGRLSRTTFTAEEIEANQNNPTANYVKIGNEPMLILDEYSDTKESFYVLSASPKGRAAFDSDSTTKFDPSDSNNIASLINGTFLTTGHTDGNITYTIDSAIQEYIPTRTWWTEAGHKDSNSPEDYSVEAKIGLLSRTEYQKYWGKFGWSDNGGITSGWWLRSGRGSGGTATTVMVSVGTNDGGKGNTWDKAANNTGFYIRPTYYLSEDVFRNVKADVNTMGSDVKKMILERYEKSELQSLYTEAELGKIGYDMVIEIPAKDYNLYTKDEAVVTVDYIAQATGDIIITYTNGTESGEVSKFLYPEEVYQETITMSELPYGENDVTVTMTNYSGTVICETTQKMYIIPNQPEENILNSGIVIHPAQFKGNTKLFEIAKKLGFTQIRTDFPWSYIETEENVNNFDDFDALVAEADRLDIKLVPILCYNNLFYSDDETDKGAINTQAELTGFVNYVKAVANRYPQIDTFEIWNEPNHSGFWSGAVNAEEYSALVKTVSDTLYEINPDYTIYAGAIDVSKDPEGFVGTMFTEGLYDYFDTLSYHPYFGDIATFENNRVEGFKDMLLDNGGFKELSATEFGYNVATDDTDGETTRAREVVKAMIVSDAHNIDDNFVFNISGEIYGALNESYAARELAYSLAYMNAALGDARFSGKLETEETISGYVYLKNNAPVAVYWSTNSDVLTLSDGAYAVDMKGNAIEGSAVTLSLAPVYVYGLDNTYAQQAAWNEAASRKAAITTRYPSITAEILNSTEAKSAILADNALTEKEKSAALYMLYEANKVNAIYDTLSDTSDLTVPQEKYNAVNCGENIYAKAALKLAKNYIDDSLALADSALADKNNIIAANNKIANDLLETAELLANMDTTASITDVAVTDGVLTFKVNNAENADIWVATYTGSTLTSVKKLTGENISYNVGDKTGKIFVWNGMTPVAESKDF